MKLISLKYISLGYITILNLCFFHFNLSGQLLYLNSGSNVYRLSLNTCKVSKIASLPFSLFDIGFSPDQNLYGIAPNGGLYKIDTAHSQLILIHEFPGDGFNSLVFNANNTAFVCNFRGDIFTYNLSSDTESYLGNVGFSTAGDLTFNNGALYLTLKESRILKINLTDLKKSKMIPVNKINDDFLGMFTIFKPCESQNSYAINDKIYFIDLNIDSLIFVCNLPIDASGATSNEEYLASLPEESIDTFIISQPTCINSAGRIEIIPSIIPSNLLFKINNDSFSYVNKFENLLPGAYNIQVKNVDNCISDYSFEIKKNDSLKITNIDVEKTNCGDRFLRLNIYTNITNNIQYSLNNLTFQNSNIFDSLIKGTYKIFAQDLNGCSVSKVITIHDKIDNEFDLSINNSYCNLSNGSIKIDKFNDSQIYFALNNNSFSQTSIFNNLTPGSYVLYAQYYKKCLDSFNVNVKENLGIRFDSIIVKEPNCELNNGSVKIINAKGNGKLLFYLNDSINPKENLFVNLSEKRYNFKIVDDIGCMLDTIISLSDNSIKNSIEVQMFHEECGKKNGQINIKPNTVNTNFSLSINDINLNTLTSINLKSGIYDLKFINQFGCVWDSTVYLENTCSYYIPNIFTPNNDGINDYFQIYGNKDILDHFINVSIFDRYGGVIYKINSLKASDLKWDGRANGVLLPNGVYTYYIETSSSSKINKRYFGDLTIIR